MMTVRSLSTSPGSNSVLTMRSDSMRMPRPMCSAGTVSKYAVKSFQVNPFHVPPWRLMNRDSSPLPRVGVPLKSMCSTQCEMPVIPGTSLRLPTRYHAQNVATGAVWTSRSKTRSPFDSVVRTVGVMSGFFPGPIRSPPSASAGLFDRGLHVLVGGLLSRLVAQPRVHDLPVLVHHKHGPLRDAVEQAHKRRIVHPEGLHRLVIEIAQQRKRQVVGLRELVEHERRVGADPVDLRVQRVEPAQVVAEPAHLLGARAGERRRKEREHRRLAAQFAHLDRLAFAVHENGFRRLLPDFECHAPPPVNKVFDFMIAGRLLLHHLADAVRDPREAAIVANGRGRRAIPARRLRGGQPCNYSVTRRPRTARAAAPSARSSPGSRSRARSRPARAPGCPSSRRPC